MEYTAMNASVNSTSAFMGRAQVTIHDEVAPGGATGREWSKKPKQSTFFVGGGLLAV